MSFKKQKSRMNLTQRHIAQCIIVICMPGALLQSAYAVETAYGCGDSTSNPVGNGDRQTLNCNAQSHNVIVSAGGTQMLAPGGQAQSYGTVLNGGAQYAAQYVWDAAIAWDTVVNNNSIQSLFNGGTSHRTMVMNGGTQLVLGNAYDTIVGNGGTQYVGGSTGTSAANLPYSGIATGTIVEAGGRQVVSSGAVGQTGTANDTAVNGGTQDVGVQGFANDTVVNGGGVENVLTGGTATGTIVNAWGDMRINQGATVNGAQINAGGVATAEENDVVINSLTLNQGTLSLAGFHDSHAPTVFKNVTVNTLAGSGTVQMSTEVSAGTSDHLTVGDVQGQHSLDIHDFSTGAVPTNADYRLYIAHATGSGNFVEQGSGVDVGAYVYQLHRDGDDYYLSPEVKGSGPLSGDGPTLSKTAEVARVIGQASNVVAYGELQQIYRRLGDLHGEEASISSGLWARADGRRESFSPSGALGFSMNTYGGQFGLDHVFHRGDNTWIVGVTAGTGSIDQTFDYSIATGAATTWNAGVYGAWLSGQGWYVDLVAKYQNMTQDFSSTTASSDPLSGSYKTGGYLLSAETGKRWELRNNWFVEPQFELTTVHNGSADYTTSWGAAIHVGDSDSVVSRTSVMFGKRFEEAAASGATTIIQPYARLSWLDQIRAQSHVTVDDTNLASNVEGNRGAIAIGISAKSATNLQFYGEVSDARGQGYSEPIAVSLGVRTTW